MKRFYKLVSTQKDGDAYLIQLDGKTVKTPFKSNLRVPNENMANTIIREWAEQVEQIIPDTMPLTQIISTQIDKVAKERDAMEAAIFKYLDTDLMCYRADKPPELRKRQEEIWDPLIQKSGHDLQTTTGLSALSQSPQIHDAVHDQVRSMPDDVFTILQLVVPISGSVVLGLLFCEQKTTADEVFEAIRIEENFKAEIYNEEFYGADPAQEEKDKAIQRDLKAAQTFLELIS